MPSIPSVQPSLGVRDLLASPGQLARAIQILNSSQLFGEGSKVVLTTDEHTHMPVVRVMDSQSGEIISQVPNATIFQLIRGRSAHA